MKINNLTTEVEYAYSDPAFLIIIESHLTHLRTTDGARVLPVTEQQGFKYEGDFFGLLDDLTIDKKYHHIVLRVNDLHSSADYKGDMSHVMIPSFSEVDMLKNVYQTSEYSVD
jgi:hypothetical protein